MVETVISSSEIKYIKISDEAYSLYKDIAEDNFDYGKWNSTFGTNLSKTIDSLIANQNPQFFESLLNIEFSFFDEMETYLSSLENFFNELETDFQIFQNENSNFLNNIETSFANLSNIDTLHRLETD